MFKKTTATLLTLSGLFAAGLLLIVLTGENVSSSMEAMPAISIPQFTNAIPTVPAVPPLSSPFAPQPTATPETGASPPDNTAGPARSAPETVPGLVRVTEVPCPTPTPMPYNASELLATATATPTLVPTVVQDAGALGVETGTTVEQSRPDNGLLFTVIALVGIGFIVFGAYGMIKGRK